jgi:hypothetical protein
LREKNVAIQCKLVEKSAVFWWAEGGHEAS